MPKARCLPASGHHDRVSPHAFLLPVSHLVGSPASGLVQDCCSRLQVPGEALHLSALLPVSLLFPFPLGSEGMPVSLSGVFLSRVPKRHEMGMRAVYPRCL